MFDQCTFKHLEVKYLKWERHKNCILVRIHKIGYQMIHFQSIVTKKKTISRKKKKSLYYLQITLRMESK